MFPLLYKEIGFINVQLLMAAFRGVSLFEETYVANLESGDITNTYKSFQCIVHQIQTAGNMRGKRIICHSNLIMDECKYMKKKYLSDN